MSIPLRSRRGAIGKGWHAVALRTAAELLLGPGRASGGRADARAGRVQWLDLSPGRARGAVLGADGEVHEAQLDLAPLVGADRAVVLRIARAHPELPARLASGTYPEEIERELAREEVSLLPRGASEISHDCSCLDWPGPCRHVAALVYVLVESVDEDPTGLLTLRGLSLGDLIAPRDEAPVGGVPSGAGADDPEDASEAEPGAPGAGGEGTPGQGAVDPRRLDPAPLAAVIGEHPAALLASFFAAAELEDDHGPEEDDPEDGEPAGTPPVPPTVEP